MFVFFVHVFTILTCTVHGAESCHEICGKILLFTSLEHLQTLGNMQKNKKIKMHQWSVKVYIKTIKKL